MKLKEMSKTELEALSYTDLTDMLLKEEKKPMNTSKLFHTICDLLGSTEEAYEANIGDYYTSLTTDKRFLLLDNGEWDLKDRHAVKIVLDDEVEEEEEYLEEPEEEIEEDPLLEETDDDSEELDDEEDDDMDELSIIGEEEIEE